VENRDEFKANLEQVKREYEQEWANFLENQSVYKFGVGDDLTEAFLIYMFGLEGAAEYGVEFVHARDGHLLGGISSDEQRLLEDPRPYIDQYLLPDTRHFQDIHIGGIPQFDGLGYGDWKGVHYNLCGEITVAVTIGVEPIEALFRFEGIYIEENGVVFTDGSAILEDHSMGTDAGDISALLREYGWQGERVGNTGDPYPWRDHRDWQPKADQVAQHLNEGRAVIALVNLDTNSNFVEPVDGHTDATHWVSILQVMETQDGDAVVRIYNPYQNREEWYSFDTLVDAWTPGPNYRAVVATPPEEMAWLPNP